jgi:LacI family transcriptional regulator
MGLTLEVIAQIAGVSRSTVSRVLNGESGVKESTRLKVQQVIDSVNFQPNMAARGLAAGNTGIIGLVIPAGVGTLFSDPYFPQLIQGISSASNAHDQSLMLWLAEPDNEARTIRKILYSGLLDGVIVSSMVIDDPIVQSLYDGDIPFILIGRHPELDVNYVDINNYNGGYDATTFLFQCGCTRIATITGPQNMIAGLDRFNGYYAALQGHDLEFSESLVVCGDFTESGGYAAIKQFLPFKPDGVFAASDIMAVGALRALREAQLSVPEDIALVGFDDAPVASRVVPPLTTMRQSTHYMGYKTLETLLDIIANPNQPPLQIILDPELVIRKTCYQAKTGLEGGQKL